MNFYSSTVLSYGFRTNVIMVLWDCMEEYITIWAGQNGVCGVCVMLPQCLWSAMVEVADTLSGSTPFHSLPQRRHSHVYL